MTRIEVKWFVTNFHYEIGGNPHEVNAAAGFYKSKGGYACGGGVRTGFSDQSHFTNYFNQFIGLAPGDKTDNGHFGITICGAKKKVNKLTGSMALP